MKIVAKLPRAGLANKLLIWSKAVVFAKINNIQPNQIIVFPWIDIPLNRLFSSDKRFYWRLFNSNDFFQRLKYMLMFGKSEINPTLDYFNNKKIFIFKKIGQFDIDYFRDLKDWNELLRVEFLKLVKSEILQKVNSEPPYHIAFHIRRGDFGEDLQTPVATFLDLSKYLHKLLGINVITYIFSDGNEKELESILSQPNTYLIKGNNAVYDMLLMSKAKIIVPSIRSTYSYYACFLSDAIILRHSEDFCGRIKPDIYGKEFFVNTQNNEMEFDLDILALIKNII